MTPRDSGGSVGAASCAPLAERAQTTSQGHGAGERGTDPILGKPSTASSPRRFGQSSNSRSQSAFGNGPIVSKTPPGTRPSCNNDKSAGPASMHSAISHASPGATCATSTPEPPNRLPTPLSSSSQS